MIFCEQIQEAKLIWGLFLKDRVVQPASAKTHSVTLYLELEVVPYFLIKYVKSESKLCIQVHVGEGQ